MRKAARGAMDNSSADLDFRERRSARDAYAVVSKRRPATTGIIPGMRLETQVAIIGAGPVGLCLALDLAWRGIQVAVIEQRRA
jgi:NADPH-dependent 2,4-dienoyl-CoA reductase/sulfur reductase-like enzyme